MSIAALNASVLTLTEEKGLLEFTRTRYDNRRQILASEKSELYSQLLSAYSKNQWLKDQDDPVETFNMSEFQNQYDAQVARLDAQDKVIEMERANISTKIEAITTSLENVQKQLSKNVENESKGIQ